MPDKGTITHVTSWLAAVAAVLTAFSFPVGYFIFSYKYLDGVLETEAEINAFIVASLVRANPNLWRYEQDRLEGLLDRRPRNGYAETRRLFDLDHKVIAESGKSLKLPCIRQTREIMDTGVPVASIEISRSLQPLLLRTGLMALFGVAIGLMEFIVLRVLPIRAVLRTEEKLRRSNEELRETNEELKNFAYIVSHDLRAPLVSIKGFSAELQNSIREMQPLLDKCAAVLDEKESKQLALILQEDIGEALGFIGSSVNRMDGLIGNILNLSRLGRKELKAEPVDMTEVSRAILASLAHQVEQKKVTVTLADLPEVIADRVAMEQIMGNLIDNALKYLEPAREGELAISAERNATEVTFRVRDNGRGIAEEDMHKVFELFRRAGKQDTKGEGMGLAYVKTLVRRQGGRIWCESQPGVGSTFSFTVSAAPGEKAYTTLN